LSKIQPIDRNEAVILIGAGGLGLQAISMLKAFDHDKIVSIDIDDAKLEYASKAGASFTVNSKTHNAKEEVQAFVGKGEPILNILDFVGSSQTTALSNSMLGKGGKMVIIGVMGGTMKISPVSMCFRSATIYGNSTGTLAHLRDVVKLAKEGRLAPIPVTVIPWDDAQKALMELREGKVQGRLILKH
jgi:alcohol dehydrogenase, propanol-preferring